MGGKRCFGKHFLILTSQGLAVTGSIKLSWYSLLACNQLVRNEPVSNLDMEKSILGNCFCSIEPITMTLVVSVGWPEFYILATSKDIKTGPDL